MREDEIIERSGEYGRIVVVVEDGDGEKGADRMETVGDLRRGDMEPSIPGVGFRIDFINNNRKRNTTVMFSLVFLRNHE